MNVYNVHHLLNALFAAKEKSTVNKWKHPLNTKRIKCFNEIKFSDRKMKRQIVPKLHGIVYCAVVFFFISIPVLSVTGNGHISAYVSSISFNSISYSILMFILFLIGETKSQYVTRLFLVNATSIGNGKKNLFYKMQSNRNYLFINKWALFLWTELFPLFLFCI